MAGLVCDAIGVMEVGCLRLSCRIFGRVGRLFSAFGCRHPAHWGNVAAMVGGNTRRRSNISSLAVVRFGPTAYSFFFLLLLLLLYFVSFLIFFLAQAFHFYVGADG